MQGRTARLAGSLKVANAQLQSVNEELKQRAFVDALTELPNRLLFEDRLRHALRRTERAEERITERNAEKLAVLFVDLDGFKPVNDSFGHAAGDQVLKEVALRLRVAARDSDTVARIGGDEFVVLMEDVTSLADCVTLAARLVEVLARPFVVAGRNVDISGSVGIVLYPDHGDKNKLVANADAAMYAAKRAGGNTYAVFEAHMDAGALEHLSLLNDLRHAIEFDQLQLYYQPKIDAEVGQIRGVEALLRWNHPQRGIVNPGVFIPIAERFGLINGIGNWVINEACRQMQAWADEGVRMRVAINLSVHQMREEDLVERIGKALARHRIDPSQLLCEITESVAMEDIKAMQHAFEGLARIGVFLSIDDFGTGYSSLSYLRQLPAKQLKIDRSFVSDIEHSGDARAIVSAVVQLAHALGLRVVAEGVETDGQRAILMDLRCDELQGFFFARPMPADALMAWAEGQRPEGSADFSPSVLLAD
jgi:diguanylate cyclase (GGDEF)-like protein